MRCVIARYPFDLSKSGVLASMKGVTPEIVTGESVTIGRRRYPVKQVGEVVTRQDRRDFTGGEVVRAMARLGFTCHAHPDATPVRVAAPLAASSVAASLAASSALLGGAHLDE
ncbi:SCO5918 family protein [Streptomyces sp. NBC_00663]|uniref:SCO5918 family protein n=1 Tax=Streptomyces sp. NBC_00663 TaxID=2975801 RepID=UPI002E36FA76|nr:SCO5918 family protein [Streptomyces sp. NBC_00663]